MQWLQTYKPSRLSSGGVGRVRPETFPLLAQFRGWAVPLDPPAEAGVNWAARRAGAGIFTGPVLRDVNARTTTADLRRSRRRFGLRDGEVSLSGEAAGRGTVWSQARK
jgi:hypothetical protein